MWWTIPSTGIAIRWRPSSHRPRRGRGYDGSPRGVAADHPEAEQRSDAATVGRLEPHSHRALALDQARGHGILHVEKAHWVGEAQLLIGHTLAVHENREARGRPPAVARVVGDDKARRMRRIDRQVVAEPGRARPPRAPEDPLRKTAVARLVVELALRRRVTRLEQGDRSGLELPLPLRFRRICGLLRLPLATGEVVPVGRVRPPVQFVERHEVDVAGPAGRIGLASYAVRAKSPWLGSARLEPLGHRFAVA